MRPGQAARDERGRVCLDDLADADLDYGADRAGLAALRRRMHKAITAYNGAPGAQRPVTNAPRQVHVEGGPPLTAGVTAKPSAR